MSTHTFPWNDTASLLEAVAAATAAVRAPDGVTPAASAVTFTYTPDLTAAQATALGTAVADVMAVTRARDVSLTVAEYQALKPFLDTGRLFVGQSQSQYMALTQAQRDRMNFDNITAIWRVLFRLLRDS